MHVSPQLAESHVPTYNCAELAKLASSKRGVAEWYRLLLAHFLRLSKGGTQAARQHSANSWASPLSALAGPVLISPQCH